MNWTGGRLQRHSSTDRKSTAQHLQKAHFARVQQNLRNGSLANKQSPAKFSVFGIDIRNRDRLEQYLSPAIQCSTFNGDNGSQRRQTSLNPAQVPPRSASDRHASQSQDSGVRRPQRPVSVKRDPTLALEEEDLYSASPPPRPVKRKHGNAETESDMASVSPKLRQQKETMSDIKRRLLRKRDWVGVTIQKPLELFYGPVKDREDIGRRRKVKHDQRAKYRSAHSYIESPFPARNRPHAYNDRRMEHIERSQPIAPDVRISINGRTVPPGVSSSTGKRRGPSTGGRGSSRAVSSEVLLLDSGSSRGVFDNSYTRKRYAESGKSESLLLGSSRATSRRRPDESCQRSHSLLALSSHDDLFGSEEDLEWDQGWAGVTADSLAKLQQNFQGHSDVAKSLSGGLRETVQDVDLHRSLRPGQEVFSSSSAPMHHPRPRTSKRSVLLQEDSSQRTESNLAQLGKPQARISSSQQIQDEIWRSWVAPDNEGEEEDDQSYEEVPGKGWISPGPSMAPPDRPPTRFIPGEDAYSSELEAPDDPDQFKDMVSDDGVERSTHEDTSSQEEEVGPGGYERNTKEPLNAEKSSQNLEVSAGYGTLSNGEGGSADREVPHMPTAGGNNSAPHDTLPSEEDPDNIWRKFVFGSSNEAESIDRVAAGCTTDLGIEPGHSSMIAHQSSSHIENENFYSRSPPQSSTSQPSQFTGNSRVASMDCSKPGRTSVYTSNGSVPSSSFGPATTSGAVRARSTSSISHSDYGFAQKRQQKVVFTKPRPFIGRISRLDVARDEEPLHIGRGFRDASGEEYTPGPKKKRNKHLSHLAESDEQDELESIEDD